MNRILFVILIFALGSLGACKNNSRIKLSKKSSLEQLNAAIEANPNQIDLLEKRAKYYMSKSNYDRAAQDYQSAIKLAPDSINYYMQIADLFMQSGKIKNAIGILKRVIKIKPDYPDAYLKLGEISLFLRKYQDVFNYANKALEVDPYSDKAYFLKAYAYKENADTNKAIDSFQKCLRNNSNNYEANVELGILFMNLKNKLAVTYFNNAIALDSTKLDAYYDLGLYYQNNDQLNKALATYKNIEKIAPDFPNSYYNIGYIYLQLLNIPDKSIPYFTKAIIASPNYYQAYYNRGLAYERLGDVFNAKADYKEALKLHSNYEKAIEGLNRVEKPL